LTCTDAPCARQRRRQSVRAVFAPATRPTRPRTIAKVALGTGDNEDVQSSTTVGGVSPDPVCPVVRLREQRSGDLEAPENSRLRGLVGARAGKVPDTVSTVRGIETSKELTRPFRQRLLGDPSDSLEGKPGEREPAGRFAYCPVAFRAGTRGRTGPASPS
jgi:hypothetical protein